VIRKVYRSKREVSGQANDNMARLGVGGQINLCGRQVECLREKEVCDACGWREEDSRRMVGGARRWGDGEGSSSLFEWREEERVDRVTAKAQRVMGERIEGIAKEQAAYDREGQKGQREIWEREDMRRKEKEVDGLLKVSKGGRGKNRNPKNLLDPVLHHSS
jgi:hypothetical protein